MTNDRIGVTVGGGQNQGVFGAGSVVIENFTIYNRAAEEPDTAAAGGEPIAPCPYPGLAYFGPNDSALFFGRDAAIDRLMEAVGRQSFTALAGASGSGKSSVVLAGLAPRLHELGGWRFSHFRIGSEVEHNPFLALARALVPFFVATEDDIERLANTKKLASRLQSGELTLSDVFADCRSRNKGSRILLIADQFEETFTLVEDEAVRDRFIDVLLAGFPDAVSGGSPDICLILTLRADFYGRALLYRPLADALQGHVENLGPMSREELRTAIVRPAENAKISFEPGLVETLLDDVESKPGSLPLLQFALREMWGLQEKSKITRKSYDGIGGVQGALARRAETIFAELTENGTNARMEADFQRLFTRLVTPGEGQEDTRRVAERGELGDAVWSLAQRLAGEGNRLVVTNAPAPSHETAEVVHEALIRNWPTLTGWINRDRAFLSWLRQIKSNIELWSADPADEGPLLRGGMLAQASDWLARRGDDLSPAERSYIETSLHHAEAEERRRIRLRRNITRGSIAAALVLGIATAVAGFAWLDAKNAGEELQRAAKTRAVELIRYAWIDLGAKQEEVTRLTAVAKQLGQPPSVLVPSIICASADCMEIKKQPDGFDCKTYLEAGFRHLYCLVRNIISFPKVQSISGLSIFRTGGPHDKELNLSEPLRFGHYDPKFLEWVEQYVIPEGMNDAWFNRVTRLVYETRIGPPVRALYHAHEILFADPGGYRAFEERYQTVKKDYLEKRRRGETNEGRFDGDPATFEKIKAAYLKNIEEKSSDIGFKLGEDVRWLSDYLATEKGDDWYLANTAGGFWVRRSIDGTEAQMFRLLKKLLQTFEPTVVGKL